MAKRKSGGILAGEVVRTAIAWRVGKYLEELTGPDHALAVAVDNLIIARHPQKKVKK